MRNFQKNKKSLCTGPMLYISAFVYSVQGSQVTLLYESLSEGLLNSIVPYCMGLARSNQTRAT